MNFIRTEVLLTAMVWAIPVLLGPFLAVRARSKVFLVLLRVLYLPFFAILWLPFFWFWAGDGTINLLAVPPLFFVLSFLIIRYGRSRPVQVQRFLDWCFFSLALAALGTFWSIVLIHVLFRLPLVIA